MTITTQRVRLGPKVERFRYVLRRYEEAAWGAGFQLTMLVEPGEEQAVYDVSIDTDVLDVDGGAHSCECPGFLRWHSPCKHICSLISLIQEGRLSV